MERQEIFIRFADLRQLAANVPTYLAKQVGINETPMLRTAVEDDFGLDGLDTESLILEFAKKYRVDLSQFDFTGFISSEGPDSILGGYAAAIVLMLALPVWLGKLLLSVLLYPFSKAAASAVNKFDTLHWLFPGKPRPLHEVLTTGDFVASAATGRFVKREQVCFILIK